MNNTIVIVLGVVLIVVLVSRKKEDPLKAPPNAQTLPQPTGSQNVAPQETFASVVDKMAKVIEGVVEVVKTTTERN